MADNRFGLCSKAMEKFERNETHVWVFWLKYVLL